MVRGPDSGTGDRGTWVQILAEPEPFRKLLWQFNFLNPTLSEETLKYASPSIDLTLSMPREVKDSTQPQV